MSTALFSCTGDKSSDKIDAAIIPNDTIYVAADSSQKEILNSLIEVYEALNPLRLVIPIYSREKTNYQYIKSDKADLIFRSYVLTDKEKEDINFRKLNPKINPFWTDGLALIASADYAADSVQEEALTAVLRGKSNAFHILIDNSNTASYALLYDRYALQKEQINAYAAGAEDSVLTKVKANNTYIGLVSSAYFTTLSAKNSALTKGIKILGLVPKGSKKAEYPFQDQLYNKTYPLIRQIYGINVGALDASGSAFAAFVMSDRGQRIILKAGLLPAKIPPRTIELVTE